jgi:hypothetical protein
MGFVPGIADDQRWQFQRPDLIAGYARTIPSDALQQLGGRAMRLPRKEAEERRKIVRRFLSQARSRLRSLEALLRLTWGEPGEKLADFGIGSHVFRRRLGDPRRACEHQRPNEVRAMDGNAKRNRCSHRDAAEHDRGKSPVLDHIQHVIGECCDREAGRIAGFRLPLPSTFDGHTAEAGSLWKNLRRLSGIATKPVLKHKRRASACFIDVEVRPRRGFAQDTPAWRSAFARK